MLKLQLCFSPLKTNIFKGIAIEYSLSDRFWSRLVEMFATL